MLKSLLFLSRPNIKQLQVSDWRLQISFVTNKLRGNVGMVLARSELVTRNKTSTARRATDKSESGKVC
jgi:hypothetical protein